MGEGFSVGGVVSGASAYISGAASSIQNAAVYLREKVQSAALPVFSFLSSLHPRQSAKDLAGRLQDFLQSLRNWFRSAENKSQIEGSSCAETKTVEEKTEEGLSTENAPTVKGYGTSLGEYLHSRLEGFGSWTSSHTKNLAGHFQNGLGKVIRIANQNKMSTAKVTAVAGFALVYGKELKETAAVVIQSVWTVKNIVGGSLDVFNRVTSFTVDIVKDLNNRLREVQISSEKEGSSPTVKGNPDGISDIRLADRESEIPFTAMYPLVTALVWVGSCVYFKSQLFSTTSTKMAESVVLPTLIQFIHLMIPIELLSPGTISEGFISSLGWVAGTSLLSFLGYMKYVVYNEQLYKGQKDNNVQIGRLLEKAKHSLFTGRSYESIERLPIEMGISSEVVDRSTEFKGILSRARGKELLAFIKKREKKEPLLDSLLSLARDALSMRMPYQDLLRIPDKVGLTLEEAILNSSFRDILETAAKRVGANQDPSQKITELVELATMYGVRVPFDNLMGPLMTAGAELSDRARDAISRNARLSSASEQGITQFIELATMAGERVPLSNLIGPLTTPGLELSARAIDAIRENARLPLFSQAQLSSLKSLVEALIDSLRQNLSKIDSNYIKAVLGHVGLTPETAMAYGPFNMAYTDWIRKPDLR